MSPLTTIRRTRAVAGAAPVRPASQAATGSAMRAAAASS
jgi:hypothetical protein